LPRLARATWRAGEPGQLVGELLPERAQVEGTLRRIYESALLLFGQRGYHAVSVRDITREVGVQASSLYAHVKSKEQVLADLLTLGHEEHRDCLRAALLEAGSEPAEQITALTRAHVGVHARYPLLTRVCNRELGALSDDSRERVMSTRLDAERLFFDVVERGRRLGAFADTDPMLAVAAIGAMGIRVSEWWHPDLGLSVDDVAETYARFAVRMLTE
jgi:AcrR family transcriptional regulator